QLNGQLRPITVQDRSIEVEVKQAVKANPQIAGEVAAPFDGVVSVKVETGQEVKQGEQIATIEAMKMEAAITAPVSGTVKTVAIQPTQQVAGGDLIVEIH